MALVLIGFMGAGKSTVARELADALGVQPQDSDSLLQERFGSTPAQMFAEEGEQAFRTREEELVVDLLERAGDGDVIALGGGSLGSERARELLASHVSVLLDVSAQTAWERVQGHAGLDRPLARDAEEFAALHRQRTPVYEAAASAILPELPPGAAPRALGALRALAGAGGGTRMLWASAASGDYPVYIRDGLLSDPSAVHALWPLDRDRSRAFCVSDATVAPLFGERLGELAHLITIPAGEQHKTLATAEAVWQELIGAGMTRADHLVALGGGVVGDLAGFCASTYQRGVPVVQVPTTLVAQVDSAYGGKTGVDLPAAKNYIGAYHQPAAVMVDPGALRSLPAAELAAGWVEVYKTALLAGGALWDALSRDEPVDELTITRCARTKLAVVAADERDAGARQMLNLGHTVGHAIETATGYARYRHGEAVGLGLLVALRLSGLDELRERTAALLAAHGLPVVLEGASPEEIQVATGRDKKRIGASVPFVLLKAPGEPLVGCEVDPADVLAAIDEIAA